MKPVADFNEYRKAVRELERKKAAMENRVELPAEMREAVVDAVLAKVHLIEKYDIPANGHVHLMLMAVPIARDIAADVLFCDEHLDEISDWLKSSFNDVKDNNFTRLSTEMGRLMVDNLRPKAKEEDS